MSADDTLLHLAVRGPATAAVGADPLIIGNCLRNAFTLADHAVAELLDSLPPEPGMPGYGDARALLSPHEHCNEVLDIHRVLLAYGDERGSIVRHPTIRHLVRLPQRRR